MTRTERIRQARDLLEELTPLHKDCGRYCGCACCEADESNENGMRLLPGEEGFYTQSTEAFPYHLAEDTALWEKGSRLVCEGHCERENRPFACRIFPMRLRILPEGCKAEIDPRAWAVCPLPERGGISGMNPAFVKAVEHAGLILLEDEEIRGALLKEQEIMDQERRL